MEARKPSNALPPADRFITRAEATRMGIERRALVRAERSGSVDAFKPGRVVVYRLRDVERLVESHRVPADPPDQTPDSTPIDAFERAIQKAQKRVRGR